MTFLFLSAQNGCLSCCHEAAIFQLNHRIAHFYHLPVYAENTDLNRMACGGTHLAVYFMSTLSPLLRPSAVRLWVFFPLYKGTFPTKFKFPCHSTFILMLRRYFPVTSASLWPKIQRKVPDCSETNLGRDRQRNVSCFMLRNPLIFCIARQCSFTDMAATKCASVLWPFLKVASQADAD